MECDYGVKDEFVAIESRRGWQPLFTEIREKSANYSIIESKKVPNRDLNRYRDVNPYDHSRIILRRGECSYINASLVKVEGIDRQYILTQGPLPTTVSHFWSMTWEQNCRVVVMLNNTIEKNQVKCHTYWPVSTDSSSVLNLEDVQLTVELMDEVHKPNYILRTIKMTDQDNEETRIVQQYHYTTWPDFGVPATPSEFIQFLQDIRETGGLGPGTEEEPIGPAIVHCSAGIGRSGTFCIVDTALLQLARGERVNVKELVLEMRRYRMGLIQTAEQLRFSYQSIIRGAEDMGIDLRSVVPKSAFNGGGNSSSDDESDDDSDDSDDSDDLSDDSAEEVDEDEDVVSVDSPFHAQIVNPFGGGFPVGDIIVAQVNSSANDSEEPPPPIPPRGESLNKSPGYDTPRKHNIPVDYDKPLPSVPLRSKRPHEHMDGSASPSEAEEDTATAGELPEDELERKRRKQVEEIPPRAAESEMRQRRRQERKERTQQIIANIKEKQKEQELCKEGTSRSSSSKWVGLSVGLIVLICVGVRYFQG